MKVRSQRVARYLAGGTIAWAALAVSAGVDPAGSEFPLTVRNAGDQVRPALALGAGGGLVAWQDAAIDGQGLGIAALRLDGTQSPDAGGAFQVNEAAAGDQENCRVVLLQGKGAFFVWQGGPPGFPHIIGRVLGPGGTFLTGDLPISDGGGELQVDPDLARLANGEIVIVWSSFRQAGDNFDVFGRRYSADGQPVSGVFRVNGELGLGRRTPTVAALKDGGFVVSWIGERQVGVRNDRDGSGIRIPGAGAPLFEVAVYARAFDAEGTAVSGDNKVAGLDAIAAHPALAPLSDGRLLLAWTRRDPQSRSNSLDIAAKVLSPQATSAGAEQLLNTHLYGDQYRPVLASAPGGVLAVWSSLGQDGSWEGVYGRWLDVGGSPSGDELHVSATTTGGQIFPAAATDPGGQILVTWSSPLPRFGLELFGQRFAAAQQLAAPSAPAVLPLSSSSVMVTWAPVAGLEVAGYRVYAEAGDSLAEVPGNFWVREGLAPSSTVGFQLAYVLPSGEVSPRSAVGSGQTWGADRNYDGLPDDWQAKYWPETAQKPGGGEDTDGDGMSNLDEWLAGTNPTDAGSALKVQGSVTPLGLRLEWATQAGFIYQLQVSTDASHWNAIGGPRFAAGNADSVTAPASSEAAFFRVVRIR